MVKMKLVPKMVSRSVGRKVLQTKKNSPHIFFAIGIVGVVGGAVLACRSTLKLEENFDEIKIDVDAVHENQKQGSYREDKDYYKDLGYVYLKSGVSLTKLYGPSLIAGGLGITCLTGSHVQLVRRNAAVTATLAALMKSFDEYRSRVQKELGKNKEQALYQDVNSDVAGEEYQKEVAKVNGIFCSPYARFFDESNLNFTNDAETNRVFIQCQQQYANHLLQVRGHVFLNDIYDSLGMDRSRAGAVVGWVRDGSGDNYIDFGIFEASNKRFVNLQERSILLDFNVDGIVYDKI